MKKIWSFRKPINIQSKKLDMAFQKISKGQWTEQIQNMPVWSPTQKARKKKKNPK